MTASEFHIAMRVVRNLARQDLIEAGVIEANDQFAWLNFRQNFVKWWLDSSEERRSRCFLLISLYPAPMRLQNGATLAVIDGGQK